MPEREKEKKIRCCIKEYEKVLLITIRDSLSETEGKEESVVLRGESLCGGTQVRKSVGLANMKGATASWRVRYHELKGWLGMGQIHVGATKEVLFPFKCKRNLDVHLL